MNSSHNTSLVRRLGRFLGVAVLTAAGIVVSIYATRRQPKTDENTAAAVDVPVPTPEIVKPTEKITRQAAEGKTAKVADTDDLASAEGSAVERIHQDTTVQPLEELTVEELYRLAQRSDIAGRSNMRKAQLIQALQAKGVDEAEV